MILGGGLRNQITLMEFLTILLVRCVFDDHRCADWDPIYHSAKHNLRGTLLPSTSTLSGAGSEGENSSAECRDICALALVPCVA